MTTSIDGVPERVYLDHAATAPMLPAAREAWLEQSARLGNPSSLHASGRAARRVVEESRERIAGYLGVRPSAVVFTGGGTESDNLAVKGLFWSRNSDSERRAQIVAPAIEHHAVLDPIEWLAVALGAQPRWLGVDALGRVRLDHLAESLSNPSGIALVTVMWANNEVGTIQPVAEIAAMCESAGVPLHTDAVQALGSVPLDLGAIGPAAVTISSHKIGGPYGVGALIADPRLSITAVLHGGGQEREIRSGTLDSPGIVAFAVAVEHAVIGQPERAAHLVALRERLIAGITSLVPDAIINGDRVDRLPGNVHVSLPDCEGDLLLMLLDEAGIDCSTGSACTAGIPEPSHVLLAMGVDDVVARGSLRLSLGEESTVADVDAFLAALPPAVERARRAGMVESRVS